MEGEVKRQGLGPGLGTGSGSGPGPTSPSATSPSPGPIPSPGPSPCLQRHALQLIIGKTMRAGELLEEIH